MVRVIVLPVYFGVVGKGRWVSSVLSFKYFNFKLSASSMTQCKPSPLIGVISCSIVWLQKGGAYLAIYLWAFMFVLSLVMMTLYPVLIAPLFNKFTSVSVQNICHYEIYFSCFYVWFHHLVLFAMCENSFQRVSSGRKLRNLLLL